MYPYQPAYSKFQRMGQAAATPPVAPPAPVVATAPATVTTTYTGVPGFLETVLVLAVSSAAAYTGVRAGMNKSMTKPNRIAGWVGGIGSAIMGMLYLGGKTGISKTVSLPSVQVMP